MPLKTKTKFMAARYGELTGTLLFLLAEGAATAMIGGMGGPYNRARLYRAFDYYSKEQVDHALRRLRICKRVTFDLHDEMSPIVMTRAGLARAEDYKIKFGHRQRPAQWDHLYRLCLFDIPERKCIRRRFQTKLKRLGWFRLHKSVYVHPHNNEVEILTLARQYHIIKNVLMLTVASLGPFEYRIRNHFFNR